MAALQQLTEATQHTDTYKRLPPGGSTYLILIGGVEGDFGHFGVLFSHVPHGAAAQLDALQQSRFRGVTGHVSLQDQS